MTICDSPGMCFGSAKSASQPHRPMVALSGRGNAGETQRRSLLQFPSCPPRCTSLYVAVLCFVESVGSWMDVLRPKGGGRKLSVRNGRSVSESRKGGRKDDGKRKEAGVIGMYRKSSYLRKRWASTYNSYI